MNNNTLKLNLGKSITRFNDPLTAITAEQLFQLITNPTPDYNALINRLRTLITISPETYREEKKKLPYFVCASFLPPIRLAKNFASTNSFIIDIDHIANLKTDISLLKEQLMADPRVVMLFFSPGGNGLKILFRLVTACDDAGIYSLFYKIFARKLAVQYQLQQVIDTRTCDVTRACFISMDTNAWYNPNAEPVNISDYLPLDNEIEMENLSIQETTVLPAQIETQPEQNLQPDNDILNQIKLTLNPMAVKTPKPDAFVPEQVNNIIPLLQQTIGEKGIVITDVQSIQYGKKIKCSVGLLWAEINLFYGKHGYSVVKTTKTGSNAELADIMQQMLKETLLNLGCYVK